MGDSSLGDKKKRGRGRSSKGDNVSEVVSNSWYDRFGRLVGVWEQTPKLKLFLFLNTFIKGGRSHAVYSLVRAVPQVRGYVFTKYSPIFTFTVDELLERRFIPLTRKVALVLDEDDDFVLFSYCPFPNTVSSFTAFLSSGSDDLKLE